MDSVQTKDLHIFLKLQGPVPRLGGGSKSTVTKNGGPEVLVGCTFHGSPPRPTS